MIDEREVQEMLHRRAATVPTMAVDMTAAVRRARRRLLVNGVVTTVAAVAIAVMTFAGVDALRSAPIPADKPFEEIETPTPAPPGWSRVHERDASVLHRGRTELGAIVWRDPHDAPVGWVDVERVVSEGDGGYGYWEIELAANPPRAAGLEPGLLIAYGLVLDTTGDGVADHLIGIDNDAPQPGDFHVWVTDLTTGETDEQIGPPYGLPIEFKHPDERRPDDGPSPPHVTLTFLTGTGSAPADLDPDSVRFYAWASATRNGEVFASDYAPDTGWMTRSCWVNLDPACGA